VRKGDNTQKVFFELIRSGLWRKANDNLDYGHDVDWNAVYQLAEEQSVVGLVAAELEWVKENDSQFKVPKTVALPFVGKTLQIELRNKAMNEFVAGLIEGLRREGVHALLVKGQGVAQCYEKPLWRSSGDIDLVLSIDNYEKAKTLLVPMASDVKGEGVGSKHLGMTIDG